MDLARAGSQRHGRPTEGAGRSAKLPVPAQRRLAFGRSSSVHCLSFSQPQTADHIRVGAAPTRMTMDLMPPLQGHQRGNPVAEPRRPARTRRRRGGCTKPRGFFCRRARRVGRTSRPARRPRRFHPLAAPDNASRPSERFNAARCSCRRGCPHLTSPVRAEAQDIGAHAVRSARSGLVGSGVG